MEQNKIEEFEEMDNVYWEEPDNHALIKANLNGIQYYSIITLSPKLMTKLCDDLEYANKLANRMIEQGVKVFEDFETFFLWYKKR